MADENQSGHHTTLLTHLAESILDLLAHLSTDLLTACEADYRWCSTSAPFSYPDVWLLPTQRDIMTAYNSLAHVDTATYQRGGGSRHAIAFKDGLQ